MAACDYPDKIHLRSLHNPMHPRIRTLPLTLMLWVTTALIFFGRPQHVHAADAGCPDLTGTYQVLRPAWIDEFHLHVTGTVRPKMQARQFATFQRRGGGRSGGYVLIWHMPREEVLAGARSVAQRDPRVYGFWLDMVLRDPKLGLPPGSTDQSWVNQMAQYGPVFRAEASLPLKECEGGWVRLDTHGRNGPPDMEGGIDGTRDVTLWLGREKDGKDGSLALKWVERRKVILISGRYLNEVAIPLWSSTHLDSWPAVPTPNISPLREEELPPRNRPKGQLLKCQLDPALASEFFVRLDARLPRGAEHVNRAPGFYQGRIRPDDSCEPMPYFLNIRALNTADLADIETFLRADPFFERMESKESETLPDGRPRVVFKMMIVPR